MAYATLAELRAMDGLGDSSVHSDALLTTAISMAKAVIDRATGTSFGDVTTPAYDAFTVTLDGSGSRSIRLVDVEGRPVLFPRTVSSVTIDGVADSGITYVLKREGIVIRSSGAFTVGSDGGQNVVVVGTAGVANTPPADVAWAARAIARNWALNQESRLPDRALNLTTPDGSFEVRAQAGAPGRPTNMPDVNAVLMRHNHYWPLG